MNENPFTSLAEARRIVEAWRIAYNTGRPHGRLGRLPPAVYGATRRQPEEQRASQAQITSRLNLPTCENRGAGPRRSIAAWVPAGVRYGDRPGVERRSASAASPPLR
jgi:hypothetical protein